MSKRRWSLWLAPPIAVAVVALALSRFQAGVEAGPKTSPLPQGACAESPIVRGADGKPDGSAGRGAWWRLTERLDANGVFRGRQLAIGQGGAVGQTLELAPESLASGPVGGVIVVTTDDGTQSEIRLISVARGCAWVLHRTPAIARGAILDPTDGSVLAHLLDRADRNDLGTWRIGAGGGSIAPAMVAPAVPPNLLPGRVFATDLRLDRSASNLAVQSCSDRGCVTRLFDLTGGAAPVGLDIPHGDLIGFAGGRLLTWTACRGLPCSIESWSRDGTERRAVVDAAEYAGVTGDGRFLLVVHDASRGNVVRILLESGASDRIRGVTGEEQVVRGGFNGIVGIQVGDDEVGVAAPLGNPRPFRPSAAEVIR